MDTVNADNRHFFLAQRADSYTVYEANLANVDTLLSTVCCNKPLLFGVKKPSVDINVNVPSATMHQIG